MDKEKKDAEVIGKNLDEGAEVSSGQETIETNDHPTSSVEDTLRRRTPLATLAKTNEEEVKMVDQKKKEIIEKSSEKDGILGESNEKDGKVASNVEEEQEKEEEKESSLRRSKKDGGYDTPDTDQEEEEWQRRLRESRKKGTKVVTRMSFKRDRVDRYYDRLPWLLGAVSRLLGLNMAPMNIPWHRRKETMAVLLWMSTFLFLGLVATYTMVYMFLYTQYWWMSLCYLCWYIPDRTICNRGGRRLQWVRNWGLWKSFRDFFPIHVVKTVELEPQHNYIMCYHPHGILCAGAFCTFATEGTGWSQMFPGLTPYLLTLEGLFLMPFFRELFLCSGAVSATRASMDHLLGKEGFGRALCLVVGGAPESLDCHPGQVILHLEKRKGFIKMALRHGASLVPMFGFGENDIYDQVANPKGSFVRKVQDFLFQYTGIPPCAFMGRGVFQYSLGFVPYRKPIYVVVGSPIHVDPVKTPTSEQILALHTRYKQALVDLYNEHKETYAKDPSVNIQMV